MRKEVEERARLEAVAERAKMEVSPTLTPALALTLALTLTLTLTLTRPLRASVRPLRARGSSNSCAHAAPSTTSMAE